jgi:hypothetical protein
LKKTSAVIGKDKVIIKLRLLNKKIDNDSSIALQSICSLVILNEHVGRLRIRQVKVVVSVDKRCNLVGKVVFDGGNAFAI